MAPKTKSRSSRRVISKVLSVLWSTVGLSAETFLPGQSLLFENFDDPATAALKFSTVGSATFTGHDVQIPANSAISLNAANVIPDTGTSAIQYSIVQSFAPGDIRWPNRHSAMFYVRASESSSGYGVETSLHTGGPYIAVSREIPGVGILTLLGGSSFATPAVSTIGPYELVVTLWNTADAVNIDVMVGGVHSLTVVDDFPERLLSGGSAKFSYSGNYSAFVDNLSVMHVSVVPEPESAVLLLLGVAALGFSRHFATKSGDNPQHEPHESHTKAE